MWKSQIWVTGMDVIQKRNIGLTRFLVQMLSRCVSTKQCLRIFNFGFKFELRRKMTWLPWQPYKEPGDIVLCALL